MSHRVTAKAQRLAAIPELLRRKPRTTHELSQHFAVPVRTIQRDLQDLRQLGHTIDKDDFGRYALPAPNKLALNEVEALAVYAATRLLYHHAPTYNEHYQAALEKLAAQLPEPAKHLAMKALPQSDERTADSRSLELVARAWFSQQVLAFDYRSLYGSGTWHPQELCVYFVKINRTNLSTYVIGYERNYHKRILTWKLARMRHTRLLTDTYTIPEDFDANHYLSAAWGVMGTSSNSLIDVCLRFNPRAAARLREGGYPNMTITDTHQDGSVNVTIRTGADHEGFPSEVFPWVQGWGAEVQVLAPAILRKRWLADARHIITANQNANPNQDTYDAE
jgi:predicted DNA-binding transcriptional regulator YafY